MGKQPKSAYKLDYSSPVLQRAVVLIGWAMFLRIAYFFAFTKLEEAGVFRICFGSILPLLTEAAFLVLIRGVRKKNTWLYCVMAGIMCLWMLIQSFGSGDVLRTIVEILLCMLCTAAPLMLFYGYIPKRVAKWLLFGTAIVRLVLFNLVQNFFGLHWITLIFEISSMLELVGLGFLTEAFGSKK